MSNILSHKFNLTYTTAKNVLILSAHTDILRAMYILVNGDFSVKGRVTLVDECANVTALIIRNTALLEKETLFLRLVEAFTEYERNVTSRKYDPRVVLL